MSAPPTSKKTTSKKTAAKATTSKKTASKKTASKKTASKKTTSKKTTSKKTAAKQGSEEVRWEGPRDWRELKGPVLLVALIGLICVGWGREAQPAPALLPASDQPQVRIALVESAPQLRVTLDGTWRLAPLPSGPPVAAEDAGTVTIRVVGEGDEAGLVIAGETFQEAFLGVEALELRPAPGAPPMGIDGRRYRGTLRVTPQGDQIRAVNSVGIEDYLAGVIGHEMPLTWDDAALQAQAIAARTYALSNLHPDRDHDLKADTRSQVYRGLMDEDERARALVEATRGEVLTWEGELFVTFFHSTCGGDTVPPSWAFGGNASQDIPPLMGAENCTCQPSRFYRWTKEVELGSGDPLGLRAPSAVEVAHHPRGLYARELIATRADGSERRASPGRVRSAYGLRSTAFDATLVPADGEAPAKLVFEGRGWGHGVGMCQFGAQGFSRQGLSKEEILLHFYPGAALDNLGY